MVEKSNKLISRLSDRELQIRHCPLEDKRAILLCQEISTQLKSPIMTEHGFTPREQEVAMQIVDGNPVQAVAATLSMSPRTLQKHLERIFRKLNVNNLAAACVKLMRADG
jgi:DNA-binding CsgD family transcriptional regulator